MTKFTEIYKMFMNDISDKKLFDVGVMPPEFLAETLEDYLAESCDYYFLECSKNLADRDTDKKQFNIDLNDLEKRIVAKGMKIKWLSSNFVANEKLFSSRLMTTDYRVFSPSNQLKELKSLEQESILELKKMIIKYKLYKYIRTGDV